MNEDGEIHGCLLFRPLPPHLDTNAVSKVLSPEKDVDAITITSMGGLLTNTQIGFAPCTATACLELLRQKLDYILIDTPPAGVLSDAAALAKYADGAIYVVRQDMANSVQIVNSVQSLSGAVPLYGCVLNCTQAGTTRSGYRYGYRYGYQYG